MKPDISCIIVNWNTRELLLECVRSIIGNLAGFQYELFVVDNGSSDGSVSAVQREFGDRVQVLANRENLGFACANNQALYLTRGRYVALINSDAQLHPDTMAVLVAFLDEHPQAAMAGPRMLGPDGAVQNSFDNFPSLLTELGNKSLLRMLRPGRYAGKSSGNRPFEVDSLIGACMLVRADAIEQVGVFDEDYFFFLEETDWCLRMRRRGWRVYHVPAATVVHLQGQSKKRRPVMAWIEYYRSMYLYFKKNHSPAAYAALRILRVAKLTVNLLLTGCGLLLTAGLRRRYCEKIVVYAGLLWWHARLCPSDIGLRSRTASRETT